MFFPRKFRAVPLLAVSLLASVASVEAAPRIVATEGFNLRLVESSAQKVVATPVQTGYAHNWFAARFDGLTPQAETTIKLEMAGNDVEGNKMNVGKWNGLRPLFTYADPNSYDAYVGYWRDQNGSWWSLDPFLDERQKFAGNAVVPVQRAMVPQLSGQFLSNQGATWFPWAEIENAKPGGNQSFTIKQKFYSPQASVAMRVPFTPRYLDSYIERLKAAQKAGVYVDEIGKSAASRSLWCIRVEDPTGLASGDEIRTVVIFAREHATEHATSWSALGAVERLMDRSVEMDELRRRVRFLIVPLQDPDGAAVSRFINLTDNWDDPKNNARLTEVLAYSAYFRDYVEKGHTLDVAVSLHNVEANEAPNFMAPFAQPYFNEATVTLNKPLFAALKDAGYAVDSPTPKGQGVMSTRLYGWLALRLGAMDVAYEVNDRDPESRLSVPGLKNMGGILAAQLGQWTLSEEGEKRHQQAREWLQKRAEKKEAYLAEFDEPRSKKSQQFDLLTEGF